MRFMCLIHYDEAALAQATPEEMQQFGAAWGAFNEALAKAGNPGERLQPSRAATTVRGIKGRTEILDGPYADTKEQFGGFYMIEAPDLDQAVAWAARCPAAQNGTVEVRPIWELTGN